MVLTSAIFHDGNYVGLKKVLVISCWLTTGISKSKKCIFEGLVSYDSFDTPVVAIQNQHKLIKEILVTLP